MPARSRLALVRARLQLPTLRRATGLLDGRHRAVWKGHGDEVDDLHVYTPGDDVGDIDWRASARSAQPVVKRYEATSNVGLVLVVDTGRHMCATSAGGEPKHEVAQLVADVVAHLAHQRGDRVSLVAGDAGRVLEVPAGTGTTHLEVLLRRVERAFDPDAPEGDLARLLDRVLRRTARRSLVVVVTDEARPGVADERALARLRTRHEVMVVQVVDADLFADRLGAAPGTLAGGSAAADRGRPVVAPVRGRPVRDVVSGWSLPAYLRGRRGVREAVAAARTARHAEVERRTRGLGVTSVTVESTHDVLDEMVALLGRSRRAGR
ncbi:DUF58 domain-containing protein [Cellulomonas dongxiuzhuiae]|uniref:DUF58 domain-containing protein n=1 Tax=Cellulomonas dongxiuzhuiae TaxID=2819979 RepID=A0ABX8GHK2_9CELL|nr:DUF58 domain-containing protein [Cellulomonas dongxiuzhuiae]MBO3087998.1 DUF58 domain-containing protein [Cellulomonas dongxiuzhuiae]MBO3094650.1 DUF58 domain-containing protein [Cellulomonas dongxiuzhuiae]QWC15659.1 DUF58 domain-containing protein [Cellulomonas dongxiuzhuiae]